MTSPNGKAVEREAFERWAQGGESFPVERCGEGYLEEIVDYGWLAWQAGRIALASEVRRNVTSYMPVPQWTPVSGRMPDSGVTVLVCYRNSLGKLRRIRAYWINAKTHESGSESEIGEYDENSDTYYDPEGWYEKIDNCGDYTAVAVCEGEVTHWMPLPEPPPMMSQDGGKDIPI
jgi:hypothetical protein